MAQATHRPSAATAAVCTFAAVSETIHELDSVSWSYSAAPTGGNLAVESPSGTTIFQLAVTAAGPGSVIFPKALKGASGQALIVTLASGAGAVVGSCNAITR